MAVAGIHGQLLEITVVGCSRLRDTEWFSGQDPYVSVEYGNSKFKTRTCTDGGKNPSFQEKFTITLIEGLREIVLVVWNSNTITMDDLIGSGKIQLQKVLTEGYDDSTWPLQSRNGTFAGDVRVIMHTQRSSNYGVQKPSKNKYASTAETQYSYPSTYAPGPPAGYPPLVAPPQTACNYSFTIGPQPLPPPSAAPSYPPPGVWPPSPQPQQAAIYPPPVYPPPLASTYPAQTYPPPSTYPPPGQYSGVYPPPPPPY